MDSTAYTSPGGLLNKKQLTAKELEQKQRLIKAGDTAFDEDDLSKALDCYHRASVIDSSDANVWSLVGLVYSNLDFNQEAWRSFKLALICDPDHLDTLWYAGEFLFNNEDFSLAKLLLERYISLEEDRDKIEEARDMLTECRRIISESGTGDFHAASIDPDYLGDEEDDDDPSELEGFVMEGEYPAGEDDFDADDEYDMDGVEEDYEDKFIASLNLDLTSMRAKCTKCSVALPMDAPYCYNCLAPHFYED